jgi:hypothetical protein
MTIQAAAERVGYSRQWGQKIWGEIKEDHGGLVRKYTPDIPDALERPLAIHELSDVARDCLSDFGRYRARFYGRRSSPWQENAAHKIIEKLRTPNKEYGVVNCPPGSGKSTLFVHDIPSWLSVRDRTLRGFIGSSTQVLANSYTGRLRDTFNRKVPIEASDNDKRLDLGYDAQSTLCLDYGLFRPDQSLGAPWSRSQFTISQLGETLIGEKEASWTAFGKDTGFLGWRVNFIAWDDLVRRQDFVGDNKLAKLELDRAWWDDEAETRLEPGGLLILQGQRLGPEDLYKYCKDKLTYKDDDDFFELGEEELPTYKKYFTVIYKAHYDEHCQADVTPEVHSRFAKAFDPEDPDHSGCLLDPMRLPMRELKAIKNRPLSNYETVYQQGDVDPANVLVPKFFIDGGFHEAEDYVGCWDLDREPGTIPILKSRPSVALSVVTADPSPTKYWSVQWWYYVQHPNDEHLQGRRYLLDQLFKPMGATDFLDYDVDEEGWTGLLVEWQKRARLLGAPIKHVIFEANAAQKFVGQYKWFKRWFNNESIKFRSHHTHINKLDPKFGVTTIKNHYRFGRVRLPGTRAGQEVAKPLYDQVTNYPDYSFDDAVMSHWFLEYQLQHLVRKRLTNMSIFKDVPSWVNREPTYA